MVTDITPISIFLPTSLPWSNSSNFPDFGIGGENKKGQSGLLLLFIIKGLLTNFYYRIKLNCKNVTLKYIYNQIQLKTSAPNRGNFVKLSYCHNKK